MNTTHKKNTTGLIRKWFTRGIACMALLFAGQSAHATTYTWANSNVNGATPASLNWFNATQGTWTGGTPVINDNTTTIQFFQDATTLFTNLGSTQASVIDNGGSVFPLGTLTLSGKAGGTSASNLVMTISGDALNFSAATGTINLNANNGSRTLTHNVNSAIQLGTASSASALTFAGNGNADFVISGVISELQLGGGSLTKSGTSTVRLSGANTYTGTTTINGGTLFLGNAGANGSLSTSSAIVVNSGTFTIARTTAVTQGTDFSGAAITGAGNFTQSGGITGTTTLNAANTYTGVTTINSGVLAFSTAADGGLASNLGQSSSAAANLLIASGPSAATLKYTGTGGSTDRLFTLTSPTFAHILDASGTGAINFTNPGAIAYGTLNQVRTLQLNGSNTGNNTLAALIQDNGTGKVSINKDWNGGAGTWVITGNNTYTGNTTLGDGTVIVTSLKNIGTASNLGAGGTINFGLYNPAGTLKYQGTGDSTDRAIDFTASGGISTMVIDQSGTGLLKFTGTFTSSGVRDGKTLRLQGSTAGTGEMQSILVDNSPANRLNVSKAGTGTWTLSGANTYTGATTVNGGTLLLDMSGSGALASTSALTLGGGKFQVKGKTSGATAQTLGNLTLTANTGSTITLDPNNSGAGSTTLTLGNAWTRGAGSSLLIDTSSANTGTRNVKTTGTITGTGAAVGSLLNYVVVKDATGTGFGVQDGSFNIVRKTSGFTTLTTINSVAGSTALDFTTSGVLTLGNVAHAANTLSIDSTGGGTLDLGGAQTLSLTAKGILMTGTGNYTIQTGTVGAAASEVIVHQMGSGILTINSLIGSTSASLTKDGLGTLILGGASTYTGATTINAGTLKLGAAGSGANTPLGTTGAGTTVNTGAALDLGGFTLVTAEALSLNGTGISSGGALLNSGSAATYSGLLTLGSHASIVANNIITLSNVGTITGSGFGLTLDGTATGSSLASIIGTGAGTLTKSGTGTWTLSGANTYTGATLINAGTLVGVVGGSCSNSAVTVASAGALGISITDITKKWTCASLALNSGSQLKFDFTVPTPHASEAPLNILGNLTFSGTPTIVVSPRTTTPGKYPLLTVGGTVLTTSLPTLSPDGVNGHLVWEGKTLWVTIVAEGTLISFF